MSESLYNMLSDVRSNDVDTVILNLPKSTTWRRTWYTLLDLPNFTLWNMTVLVVTVANFYLTTISFSFLPDYVSNFVSVFFISDLIYIFNFILLLLHRFWKNLNTKLPITVRTPILFLVLDLISILPQATTFVIFLKPKYHPIILYCRLVTCLRLHNVLFLTKVQKRVQENHWVWFLVQWTLIFFIILHLANFSWCLITCTNLCGHELIWRNIGRQNQTDCEDHFDRWYFITTYRSMQILLNVGFGDFYPTAYCQIFWFLIVLLSGQFLTIIFISVITWLIINYKFHEFMYIQKVAYAKKYTEDVSDSKRKYIKNFYQYLWDKHDGIYDPPSFNLLPSSMKMDITFDINCGLLHRSILLKHLPQYIKRKISLAMKDVYLLPGEVIYYQYVVKKYMVFIEKGVLQLLYDDDDHSPIISFKDGTIFGETSLFFNIPAKTTVRAPIYTELKVLEKQDFIKIMTDYPDELKILRKSIENRISLTPRDNNVNSVKSQGLRRFKAQLYEASIRLNKGSQSIMDDKDGYLTLYKPSKTSNIDSTTYICVNNNFPWVLQENSSLLKIWKLLTLITQLTLCLLYPYYVVFERQIPYYLFVFGLLTDILCFVELLLQCATAVNVKEKTITRISEILDYRLDSWRFCCDVLSLFPIEIWAYLIENPSERNRFYDLLKLNRLLRIWRISDFFTLFETKTKQNFYIIWLMKSITYMLIFTYYASCAFYLQACLYQICDENSWFYQTIMKEMTETQENRYGKFALVTSIYFTIMSAFHMGIGDILPKSDDNIAMVICTMCTAALLKSYCIGQLASCLFLNNFCKRKCEVSYYLKMFLTYFKSSKLIERRIQANISVESYFCDKYGKAFIRQTIPMVQKDIETTKIQNISEIPLLEMVDPYFLTMVEKNTTIYKFAQNEILYYYGDPTRQMFIVDKGCCGLHNSDNVLVKTLGPDSQLGMIEMLAGIPKQHTVIAVTDCVITGVEYSSFCEILKTFPKEHEIIDGIIKNEEFTRIIEEIEYDYNTAKREHIVKTYKPTKPNSFITMSWIDYWKPYKKRLGFLWFFGVLLMPISIHPDGYFLQAWCAIRCILICIMVVTLPVLLMAPPFADGIYWLFFVCYMSLYVDIYFLFHIAYYNQRGLFKTHPIYTAWHYITHSFLIDLIAAIPMDQIMFYINPSHACAHTKITHIFAPHSHHCRWKLVGLIQAHRIFQYLNNLEVNMWKLKTPVKILKIMLTLMLIINILTSLTLDAFCNYDFDWKSRKHSYKENFQHPSNGSVYFGNLECNSSIFDKAINPTEKYVIGFYIVTSLITTTGFGDFNASTWITMIGVILIVIIGFVLFATLTATISTVLLQEEIIKRDYSNNVAHLIKFFRNNNLSKKIELQVVKHLNFILERTDGLNYSKIVHDLELNRSLTEDILLSPYQHALKSCALFAEFNEHFLRLIVKDIQLLHFGNGEIIIRHRDVISKIFIILFGQVEILNEEKDHVITIGVGGTFGNVRHSIHSSSRIYAVARRNVSVYGILTEKFLNVIKHYPHMLHKVKDILKAKIDYLSPIDSSPTLKTDAIEEPTSWNELESDEGSGTKASATPIKSKHSRFLMPLRWFRFSVNFNNNLIKVMDDLTCLASLFNMLLIPYIFITQEESYWCYSDLLLEPIFYARVYIKLHKCYVNINGNVIRSNKKIAKKYLNNRMGVLRDIVPNIPIFLTCLISSQDERFFLYTSMRLLHLLRLCYIWEYFNDRGRKLKVNSWLLPIRLSVLYCIIIHWLSCFSLMMACPFNKCSSDTWISKYKENILSKSPSIKIILAYYYIISTITTTGIGDVLAQNLRDVIFIIMVMLIGKIMISIFIGGLLRAIYLSNIDLVRFEYNSIVLKKYLQNHSVSDYQLNRTWLYLQKMWFYEEGTHLPKLLYSIPYVLRCNVMTSLYGNHLRRSFLFKNIEESLLKQICSKLKLVVFFQDDYIVKYGDTNSCMYFIHNGDVCAVTKHHDLTETQHIILHPNDAFGVSQGLRQGSSHHFTYRAASNVADILILSFDSWSYLLPYFPQDERHIFTRVKSEYTTL